MISEQITRNTKLYKFMKSRKSPGRPVKFDSEIWDEAIALLSDLNRPEYYFDFEDRLIEEIVVSLVCYPNDRAKAEMVRIKGIVDKKVVLKKHCKPFLKSIRTSVSGAVGVAIRCL